MSFVYHGVPRSSQELVYKCPCFRGSNWNLGENWSTRRKKNPRSRLQNQQQTQTRYDAGSKNRTWDTSRSGQRDLMSFCFSPRKCQATYAMPKRISCSIVEEPVGCLLFHLIYQFVNLNMELKTAN